VVDGHERLLSGVAAAAREEVEQLYETSLKNANPRERRQLLAEMQMAIKKRAHELMPSVSDRTLY
jgi:hypothetical protein